MFNFKTSKLGRFINQNILGGIIAIIAIVLVIFMVQVLNQKAKEENQVLPSQRKVEESSETIVSGANVSEAKQEENTNQMDAFFDYCNSQNIESAYELISKECKEELYPTIEDFKTYYYDKVFTISKSYEMQSWISNGNENTYKIRMIDDMLLTGQYNNSEVIEDYITVVEEDGETRLSINGYIGKEEIHRSKEENLKNITILKKQIYMDYEIYTIQVQNNTNYDMLLDSKESGKSVYILGENQETYSAYMDEVLMEDLVVRANELKTIEIKFNKMYNPSVRMKSMVFSDMIQDYELYSILKDKNKYGGRLKIEIEI